MLGITPLLLSRPLGYHHTTQVLRTVVTPYKQCFIRYGNLRTLGSVRHHSKVAGDNESGHIEAGENEGMFFIDSGFRGIWLFTLQFRLKFRRCLPSKALLPHMASVH